MPHKHKKHRDHANTAPAAQPATSSSGLPVRNTLQECRERQELELEALRSIYLDDIEVLEVPQLAWKQNPIIAFTVCIRSEDGVKKVWLHIEFPPLYPKIPPIVKVKEFENVRRHTRSQIRAFIHDKPKTMPDQEMGHAIIDDIKTIFLDGDGSGFEESQTQSLDAERLAQEEEKKRLAQKEAEIKEQELREQQDSAEAAEREKHALAAQQLLESLQEEEQRAQEDALRKANLVLDDNKQSQLRVSDVTTFESVLKVRVDEGTALRFMSVYGNTLICEKPHKKTYCVKAFVSQDLTQSPILVMKVITVRQGAMSMSGADLRHKMHRSEQELKRLKDLKSPYLVDFLGLMLHADPRSSGNKYDVYALFEHANGGSLLDLLRMVGNLSSHSARPWMIQLTEAVEFYHSNGLVHGFIDKLKVFLFRSPSGNTVVKLLANIESHLPLLPRRKSVNDSKKYPPRWTAPEFTEGRHAVPTQKTDVWDLGVVFAEMAFGPDLKANFTSLGHLAEEREPSAPFRELLQSMFRYDSKHRPKAIDIPTFEFFRLNSPFTSSSGIDVGGAGENPPSPALIRPRSGALAAVSTSRYASDFQEERPLGKGGFGQVVRARNKFDNRVYAVKKISSRSESSLQQALSETILLSRLNHPYVVRYHAAWVEDTFGNIDEADDSEEESGVGHTYTTRSEGGRIHQSNTTGGYDYIRRKGIPHLGLNDEPSAGGIDIVFGEDTPTTSRATTSTLRQDISSEASTIEDDSEESNSDKPEESDEVFDDDDDDDGDESEEDSSRKDVGAPAQIKTLYIQMEYCENLTLRGLIDNEGPLEKDLLWKIFRQICDGLRDIHSHNIIHRDLKPANIFIDDAFDPRIGDFGLATSGQSMPAVTPSQSRSNNEGPDFTRDIGTTYYVAPEVSTSSQYTTKVDMYSLGIIFFEMCYQFSTGMERAEILNEIRQETHVLPEVFNTQQKKAQGEIINSLISHNPDERPSANDLLQSGRIPFHLGEEELKKSVLKILDNPHTAEYQKILNTIFSHGSRSKGLEGLDLTWDQNDSHQWRSPSEMLVYSHVPDRLSAIFKRHGALQTSRKIIFPSWDGYTDGAVRLLGPSGNLLQLRYDLTFPYARAIAKKVAASNKPGMLVEKTFAFGDVYRRKIVHGEPEQLKEVDFDIVAADYVDFPLKAAEVIKVLDEIIEEFPPLRNTNMCFHINHGDILEAIMEFCNIDSALRPAVKDAISHLHAKRSAEQVRADLLELGVASTSINDLFRFDFRSSSRKARERLVAIFGAQGKRTLSPIFEGLQAILDYCELLQVKRRIYVRPLASQNARLFRGSMLFQCVFDLKNWDVFAAGGRYDELIRSLAGSRSADTYVAVGFNLSCTRLCRIMTGYLQLEKKPRLSLSDMPGSWRQRRCDVLVASFDDTIRLSDGVAYVAHLWANNISAELASETSSSNELFKEYEDVDHSWIVIVKHDTLKVVMMPQKDDFEMKKSKADLVDYLRSALHQRNNQENMVIKQDNPVQSQKPSKERNAKVRWIGGNAKSKRGVKRADAEDQAYQQSSKFLEDAHDAPIAIIGVGPDTLEAVRNTRLSSPESWRALMQSAPIKDHQSLKELHECLKSFASDRDENGQRVHQGAFVSSSRSGYTFFYDLS